MDTPRSPAARSTAGTTTVRRPANTASDQSGVVCHAGSSYARGDPLVGVYHSLDHAPKGRKQTGAWWHPRDEYGAP